ncbi:nicotinate-nicotinamide nucleotide adenylyltransferase, partial [Candidatus Pelagibacter sp.]|nr:nicotinate-nicotinamide nucleotide adenylyltransferase [Candidatus Pelagibacter sp.]
HGYKKSSLKSKTFKELNKSILTFVEFEKVNISSSQLRKI